MVRKRAREQGRDFRRYAKEAAENMKNNNAREGGDAEQFARINRAISEIRKGAGE